jgi:nucleoside-diphosphate-sugar epimerase
VTAQRVLVTGSTGLIGRALLERLADSGADAVGLSRGPSAAGVVRGDLTDPASATAVLDHVSPNVVVHLAGSSTGSPSELHAANVETTRNLMTATALMAEPPRLVVAGSAAEYGDPTTERVSEDHPLRPLSDYGRSKAEQTGLVRALAPELGLHACVVRPFNIVSDRLPVSSPLGNMRRQLLGASSRTPIVRCGRLDVIRDFVALDFVVDVLVHLLSADDPPPVLNICSGVGIELAAVLERLALELDVEPTVDIDPQLAAIPATPRIVGDPTRLERVGLRVEADVAQLARTLIGAPARVVQ